MVHCINNLFSFTDDIKLVLAKEGLCELLFNLLEQHKSLVQDEESRALMKLACDLIVLILTGGTFLFCCFQLNKY